MEANSKDAKLTLKLKAKSGYESKMKANISPIQWTDIIKIIEDKKEELSIKSIEELLESNECPLPLSVIPNHMGINLCSVKAISWKKQEDGQLINLTIHFIPNNDNNAK